MKSTRNSGMLNDSSILKAELEYLTSTMYDGDATIVVYTLMKGTKDLKGLLNFLSLEVQDVHTTDADRTDGEDGYSRPCFEKWIAECEQL